MNKQKVQRRDFLKGAGSFLLGAVLIPFERLFREEKNAGVKPSSMKEAMHYTVDDNLAG